MKKNWNQIFFCSLLDAVSHFSEILLVTFHAHGITFGLYYVFFFWRTELSYIYAWTFGIKLFNRSRRSHSKINILRSTITFVDIRHTNVCLHPCTYNYRNALREIIKEGKTNCRFSQKVSSDLYCKQSNRYNVFHCTTHVLFLRLRYL